MKLRRVLNVYIYGIQFMGVMGVMMWSLAEHSLLFFPLLHCEHLLRECVDLCNLILQCGIDESMTGQFVLVDEDVTNDDDGKCLATAS